MERAARLLRNDDKTRRIIEIGAGYSPVAPKSAGWRTHVVDHASRDDLRTKYSPAQVDIGLIEEVDTIWHQGPLDEAVPPALSGQIDLIIASHVLEHIPDLIGFFQAASRLVHAGGCLSIALPDRRYCFDCFRPWTTTGDLLDAHRRRAGRHGLKTAFDQLAYAATVDGQLAWGPRPIDAPAFLDPFAVAVATTREFQDRPDLVYADYHAWQFTPAGFRLVMLELAALGVCDWLVTSVHGPEGFEFFAELRRDQEACLDPEALQRVRRTLLLAQMAETREQIDLILGDGDKRTPNDLDLGHRLAEQEVLLRHMAETMGWLRAILLPVRTVWRRLRGKR